MDVQAEKTATPTIYMHGKKRRAVKPKAVVWREFSRFMDGQTENENTDAATNYARLIVMVFPDLTAEELLNNIDIEDLKPLYELVALWITKLVNGKLNELPKAESPAS